MKKFLIRVQKLKKREERIGLKILLTIVAWPLSYFS